MIPNSARKIAAAALQDFDSERVRVDPSEVSEDLIARTFTRRYRTDSRFDHTEGRWRLWTGTAWQTDECGLTFERIRETARELTDGKRSGGRASVVSGAERFAQSDPAHAVTSELWDADPMCLATPGGYVDLRTGKLRTADPTAYVTKLAGCTPSYGTPQRWLQFLNECMAGDAETVAYLQRVAGYCLSGLTTEQALFFIYGPGGNGKSVFLNLLTHIMGQHAMTAAMETFTASTFERHSTDLAMLKGARLVTASETEEGRSWAESRIKQMTGGDPITARFMRRDNFTYQPQFKLLIVGNHAPMLRNVDDAMRRRFNIIPFVHRPVKPDPDLEAKLKAEAGQILQWAINGCLEWQRIGLAPPRAVQAATWAYFEEQDTFGSWLKSRCADVRQHEPHRFATAKELFESWCSYARELGEEPGTAKRFGASMAKHGYQSQVTRTFGGVAKAYFGLVLGRR